MSVRTVVGPGSGRKGCGVPRQVRGQGGRPKVDEQALVCEAAPCAALGPTPEAPSVFSCEIQF